MMPKIKVASLFTGVGGAEIGFERAFGRENVEHIWFGEFDKFCNQVLTSRFPGVANVGDVTKVDWSSMERPEILHASPSCQAFSQAGKQMGMADYRGQPIWDAYFRCLDVLRPPIITMEEVPALASRKFTKEWQWIQDEWRRLGYHVKWTTLQSMDYGSAQSRKRLIAVGFQEKSRCDSFEWPRPRPGEARKLSDILQPEEEVDAKFYLTADAISKLVGKMRPEHIERMKQIGRGGFTYSVERDCPIESRETCTTLTASDYKGLDQHAARTGVISVVLNRKEGIKKETDSSLTLTSSDWRGLNRNQDQNAVAVFSRPHGHFDGSVDSGNFPTVRQSSKDNSLVASIKCVNGDAPQSQRVYSSDGASPTLYAHEHDGGSDSPKIVCVNADMHQDYRIYDPDGTSPTLASNRGGGSSCHPVVVVDGSVGKPYLDLGDVWIYLRRLSPIETCRLMTWPDDWNACVSNSQRYRQCGNGIVSDVVAAVAAQILSVLG